MTGANGAPIPDAELRYLLTRHSGASGGGRPDKHHAHDPRGKAGD